MGARGTDPELASYQLIEEQEQFPDTSLQDALQLAMGLNATKVARR